MLYRYQILQNWLHGHALDEYAIGYDAISVVRLIATLDLMPGGAADLGSDAWKAFAVRLADSITPTGCFSNHGGGLQDDGAPDTAYPWVYGRVGDPVGACTGVLPFTYFFERAATLLQHRDPAAAGYCKWAARSLFRQINPYADFQNFYYVIKALGEEKAQVAAGEQNTCSGERFGGDPPTLSSSCVRSAWRAGARTDNSVCCRCVQVGRSRSRTSSTSRARSS